MKIIIDEKIPYLRGLFDKRATVKYLPANSFTRETIEDASVLVVRSKTLCNRELLEGSDVKFIATCTIGYDHIDTRWCDKNNIRWVNAPGSNSSSVMQYVIASILHITMLTGKNPFGMTLGVIGEGHIGSKVVRHAKALGMKVLVNDPPRERTEGKSHFTDLKTLLTKSDIVTLHVPLAHHGEDSTFHLANAGFFEMMKPGAYFINTSRGEVTETAALKAAILSGKLSGTALDVWENEPSVDKELLALADIATPHIAGYSIEGRANASYAAACEVAVFTGISIDKWEPTGLPSPKDSEIDLTTTCNDLMTAVYLAVIHTCPLEEDTLNLKYKPGSFEEMRSNYKVRREFTYYSVSCQGKASQALKEFGFKIT